MCAAPPRHHECVLPYFDVDGVRLALADGPSVHTAAYFDDVVFPTNMPMVWSQNFVAAVRSTGRAAVIGELGGTYQAKDKVWQDWAIDYAATKSARMPVPVAYGRT